MGGIEWRQPPADRASSGRQPIDSAGLALCCAAAALLGLRVDRLRPPQPFHAGRRATSACRGRKPASSRSAERSTGAHRLLRIWALRSAAGRCRPSPSRRRRSPLFVECVGEEPLPATLTCALSARRLPLSWHTYAAQAGLASCLSNDEAGALRWRRNADLPGSFQEYFFGYFRFT